MKKLIFVLCMLLLSVFLLTSCTEYYYEIPALPPETLVQTEESEELRECELEPELEPINFDDIQHTTMSASLSSVLLITEDSLVWVYEPVFHAPTSDWGKIEIRWNVPSFWMLDNAVHVAAGSAHNFVIDADGVLWAWGENDDRGKLGDGTDEPRHEPVAILEDVVYVAISPVVPNSHVGDAVRSYAITADGTLWGWGQNGFSFEWPVALGDGTDISRNTPVPILDRVISVVPTRDGAYAVTDDGMQWWWGNRGGEARLYPVRVDSVDYVPDAWMSAVDFYYEIDEYGTLWTWGVNQLPNPEYQLYAPLVGDGTTESRAVPVAVMEHVRAVTVIADTIFVIDDDDVLWAWGANNLGQLGDGTTETRLLPVQIMDNVTEISAHYFWCHGGIGFMNTFVLTNDEQLWRIGSLRGHGGHVMTYQAETNHLPMRLHPG